MKIKIIFFQSTSSPVSMQSVQTRNPPLEKHVENTFLSNVLKNPCTVVSISRLELNLWPRNISLSLGNVWKLLGAKSGHMEDVSLKSSCFLWVIRAHTPLCVDAHYRNARATLKWDDFIYGQCEFRRF